MTNEANRFGKRRSFGPLLLLPLLLPPPLPLPLPLPVVPGNGILLWFGFWRFTMLCTARNKSLLADRCRRSTFFAAAVRPAKPDDEEDEDATVELPVSTCSAAESWTFLSLERPDFPRSNTFDEDEELDC